MTVLVGILAVVTAVVTFLTAVVVLITRKHVKDVQKDITEVHIIVNSQQDRLLTELEQLKALLRQSGIGVPPSPQRPAPGEK